MLANTDEHMMCICREIHAKMLLDFQDDLLFLTTAKTCNMEWGNEKLRENKIDRDSPISSCFG